MRRVAILIAAFVLLAGVIRVASDAYEHHGHGSRADTGWGLRMTAADGAGKAARGQRILAVSR
jgi:hypothetical protein